MASPLLGKSCPANLELNPFTKRCNKKCTSGKERVTNIAKKKFNCYKMCKPGSIRNNDTNRCRQGTTKGKSKSKSKKSVIKNPPAAPEYFTEQSVSGSTKILPPSIRSDSLLDAFPESVRSLDAIHTTPLSSLSPDSSHHSTFRTQQSSRFSPDASHHSPFRTQPSPDSSNHYTFRTQPSSRFSPDSSHHSTIRTHPLSSFSPYSSHHSTIRTHPLSSYKSAVGSIRPASHTSTTHTAPLSSFYSSPPNSQSSYKVDNFIEPSSHSMSSNGSRISNGSHISNESHISNGSRMNGRSHIIYVPPPVFLRRSDRITKPRDYYIPEEFRKPKTKKRKNKKEKKATNNNTKKNTK